MSEKLTHSTSILSVDMQGAKTKMAASDVNSCIYITDTPNQIKNKVSNIGSMSVLGLARLGFHAENFNNAI